MVRHIFSDILTAAVTTAACVVMFTHACRRLGPNAISPSITRATARDARSNQLYPPNLFPRCRDVTNHLDCVCIEENRQDRSMTHDEGFLRRLNKDSKMMKFQLKKLEKQVRQQMKDVCHPQPTNSRGRSSPSSITSLIELSSSMRRHETVPPFTPSSPSELYLDIPSGSTSGSAWTSSGAGSNRSIRIDLRKAKTTNGPHHNTILKRIDDSRPKSPRAVSVLNSSDEALDMNDGDGNDDDVSSDQNTNGDNSHLGDNTYPGAEQSVGYYPCNEALEADDETMTPLSLSITTDDMRRSDTPQRAISVAGKLYTGLPANLVSYGMVRHYNIKGTSVAWDATPSTFKLSSEREASIIGMTEPVRVSRAVEGQPQMSKKSIIRFLIFESHEPYLILGSPFVEKQDDHSD